MTIPYSLLLLVAWYICQGWFYKLAITNCLGFFFHYQNFAYKDFNEPSFIQFLSRVFCSLFLTRISPNIPLSRVYPWFILKNTKKSPSISYQNKVTSQGMVALIIELQWISDFLKNIYASKSAQLMINKISLYFLLVFLIVFVSNLHAFL